MNYTDLYFDDVTLQILNESFIKDIYNKAKNAIKSMKFDFIVNKVRKINLKPNLNTVLKAAPLNQSKKKEVLTYSTKFLNDIVFKFKDQKNINPSKIRKEAEKYVSKVKKNSEVIVNKSVEVKDNDNPGDSFRKDKTDDTIDTKLMNSLIIFFMFLISVTIYLLKHFSISILTTLPIYKIIFIMIVLGTIAVNIYYVSKSYNILNKEKINKGKGLISTWLQKAKNRILHYIKLLKSDKFFIETNMIMFIVFPVGLVLTTIVDILVKGLTNVGKVLSSDPNSLSFLAIPAAAISIGVLVFFFAYQLVSAFTGIQKTIEKKKEDLDYEDDSHQEIVQDNGLEENPSDNNSTDDIFGDDINI